MRPSRLAIAAKDEGGLQHAGLPMVRRDPQDIIDCGRRLVVGARDFRTVLELNVVIDLAVEQVQPTRLACVVREANRLRKMDDRIQFAGLRILGQLGLRFSGETEGGIELAPLQGRFRLRHFRRWHVSEVPKTRTRSMTSHSSGWPAARSAIRTDCPCSAPISIPANGPSSSFRCRAARSSSRTAACWISGPILRSTGHGM